MLTRTWQTFIIRQFCFHFKTQKPKRINQFKIKIRVTQIINMEELVRFYERCNIARWIPTRHVCKYILTLIPRMYRLLKWLQVYRKRMSQGRHWIVLSVATTHVFVISLNNYVFIICYFKKIRPNSISSKVSLLIPVMSYTYQLRIEMKLLHLPSVTFKICIWSDLLYLIFSCACGVLNLM